MPPITASLVIAIDRPTYPISDTDFLELKKAVGAELQAQVPGAVWTAWDSLTIPSHHLPETDVRAALVDALKVFNNDPGTDRTLSLTGGNAAALPLHVVYVYVNGQRKCVHDYALESQPNGRAQTRWEVSYTNAGGQTYSVGLNGSFSWDTPWQQ